MRKIAVILSLVALQLCLHSFLWSIESSNLDHTLVSQASWEHIDEQGIDLIHSNKDSICRQEECSLVKLEAEFIALQPYSFSDIISKEYEFLSFDAQREHTLSVLTESTTIDEKEDKERESGDHFLVGRILLLASSVKQLETFTPSYTESASGYELTLGASVLLFVNIRTNSSEILEIIGKYIDLPPPVA